MNQQSAGTNLCILSFFPSGTHIPVTADCSGIGPDIDRGDAREFDVSKNRIVSIVDDDESVRSSIEDLMSALGFVARAFESAEEFLNSPDSHRTACLITDLQMPGTSGQDLQNRLLAAGRAPPMIFITAFPEKNTRERVMAKGALALLEKPIDCQRLIGLVEKAMAAPR
jgi:FixJ family two-component response regulator